MAGSATQLGTPKEMKEWLQRVEQLLQKAVQLEKARAELRSLESTQALHLESLTAELEKLGYQQELRANGLEPLLVRSEQIASEHEATTRRQGEIEAALNKLEIQLKSAKESLLQVNDEQQQWEATWAEAVDGLGIGTKPHRELALETMDKLEELFEQLREADTAHKRIYGMDKDEERFTDAVTIVTQQIGIDIGDRKPAEVTISLVKQLSKAQADAATLHRDC